MDIYDSRTGTKVVGIGEATVIKVRQSAQGAAHEIVINHPDFGETAFIPFIPAAGLYRVPRVGDTCYVFCNENFYQYQVAWGHRISPQLAAELIGGRTDNITVLYSSGPSNNSVTHKIELDDGAANGIRITTGSGQQINMSNEGSITVSHKDGASMSMSGDTITLSAGGSTLTIGSSGIEIKGAGGSDIKVGANIEGKSADSRAKFDEVTVSKHQHTGNLGYPTAPPTPGT
jgi:hypothetical protein